MSALSSLGTRPAPPPPPAPPPKFEAAAEEAPAGEGGAAGVGPPEASNQALTCHKCGSSLKDCDQRFVRHCPVCVTGYHTHDCGYRLEAANCKTPLESCPRCAKICWCNGGPVICRVGSQRQRRFLHKRSRTSASASNASSLGETAPALDDLRDDPGFDRSGKGLSVLHQLLQHKREQEVKLVELELEMQRVLMENAELRRRLNVAPAPAPEQATLEVGGSHNGSATNFQTNGLGNAWVLGLADPENLGVTGGAVSLPEGAMHLALADGTFEMPAEWGLDHTSPRPASARGAVCENKASAAALDGSFARAWSGGKAGWVHDLGWERDEDRDETPALSGKEPFRLRLLVSWARAALVAPFVKLAHNGVFGILVMNTIYSILAVNSVVTFIAFNAPNAVLNVGPRDCPVHSRFSHDHAIDHDHS